MKRRHPPGILIAFPVGKQSGRRRAGVADDGLRSRSRPEIGGVEASTEGGDAQARAKDGGWR
jgi:hypothetical protein